MNRKKAKRGRPPQPAGTPASLLATDHLIIGRPAGRRAVKATNKPAVLAKWYRKKRKKPDKPAIAPESAKTLTPDQARREYFTFMGRTAFYAALKRREIPSVRIGKRLFVPRAAIEHLLLSCEQSEDAGLAGETPPPPPPAPLSQRRKAKNTRAYRRTRAADRPTAGRPRRRRGAA